MPMKFVRIGKAQGGIFQYKPDLGGGKYGPKAWALDYRDGRGKKSRKMGLETRADAVVFQNENDVATSGPVLIKESVAFATAVEHYVEARTRAGKKPKSYNQLPRFVAIFGTTPIRKLTPERITAALEGIVKEYGLSLSSRDVVLSQLSGVFTYARKRRWIREHPTRDGLVERFEFDNTRTRWFRPHEIQAIAKHARCIGQTNMADVIEFGVLTGKRISEIVRIRRCDVTQTPNGRPAVWIGETKNGDPELVPVTGDALELVKRKAKAATSPSSYLFPGPAGGCGLWMIEKRFPGVVKAVAEKHPEWGLKYGRGRDEVSFHTLRRTFATLGHAAGMTETMLMQAAGWKTRTMIDKYVCRNDDALRAALGKVGSVVFGTFAKDDADDSKRASGVTRA